MIKSLKLAKYIQTINLMKIREVVTTPLSLRIKEIFIFVIKIMK